VVQGQVVDFRGEALPGVAVSLDGQDASMITDGVGQYKAPVSSPADVELRFVKTGYTAGRLALQTKGPGAVNARPVMLWRLPQAAGVYLLEDYRYRRTSHATPRPFSSEAKSLVYGVAKLPELEATTISEPLIVVHKLPSYDVRLCRLGAAEAAPLDATTSMQEVWAADETLPVQMVPVDEPERVLWRVGLFGPLAPGVYAVHWGALDGHADTDPRIFLFRVTSTETDTPEQAGQDEGVPSEANGDGAADDAAPAEAP